jgi:predicted RNA binding protein YcfA (HicA-like mRNA interferase family)
LPKLRIFSGRQVCDILSRHGFVQVRQRGSHIVMQKKISGTTITVPVPDHTELRIGTLKSIIRQSQLSQTEFEA